MYISKLQKLFLLFIAGLQLWVSCLVVKEILQLEIFFMGSYLFLSNGERLLFRFGGERESDLESDLLRLGDGELERDLGERDRGERDLGERERGDLRGDRLYGGRPLPRPLNPPRPRGGGLPRRGGDRYRPGGAKPVRKN